MIRDPVDQFTPLADRFAQLHNLLVNPEQKAIATRLVDELQTEVEQRLQAAHSQIETLQRQIQALTANSPATLPTGEYPTTDTLQLMTQAERAARVGGWELSLPSAKLYWTETLYHIFEVPLDFDLSPETVLRFQPIPARAQIEDAMHACLASGEPLDLEVELVTYTSRPVWVRITAAVEQQGETEVRLYGAMQDINSFKVTERALQESELRFRQLAEHINSVFWLTEADAERLLYVSPSYEELWERPRAALAAKPYDWLEAVHPDDRSRVYAAISTSQLSGNYDEEYRLLGADGTIRWVRDRSFPIFDESGELYRIAGLTEEITSQRQAAEALRESEERFRQLAENIHQAFWLADQTRVLYVSPAYEQIWGQRADQFYADPWQWLGHVHPEDRARVRAAVEFGQTYGQGQYDEEYRIIRPDGALRWVRDRAFPILDEHGQMMRIAGLAADITAQKRQSDAMQLLLECAHVTGAAFFTTLVGTLAKVLDMPQVLLCELDRQANQLRTIAVWDQGMLQPNLQLSLQSGGVLEAVLQQSRTYAHNVAEQFPNDRWLQATAAESCVGAPLQTAEGHVIGCLIALSPLPNTEAQIPVAILEIFASRAVNELERQQAEAAIKALNLELEERVNERTAALAAANAALQLREQQLRQIIDLVPHQLFVQDLEGRFILANQATADHYNTTVEALVGKAMTDLNDHPPPFNLTIQDDLALMRTGRPRIVHLQKLTDAQSNLQILQTTIVPFVLSGIETPGVIGISIDITEQKRIEEELRRSEARQRAMLEAMPDLFFRISGDGYFLDFSTPTDVDTLIAPEKIIGSHVSTLPLPTKALDQSLAAYRQAIATGSIQTVEYSAMSAEGLRYFESRVVRAGPDEVVSIVRDITQRVKAEEALRSSEEKFVKLFYTSPLPMMITRLADGAYIDINDQCLDFLGLQRDPVTNKIVELVPIWPSPADQQTIIQQLRQQGSLLNVELTFRVRTGELRETLVSVAMLSLNQEEFALWAIADITERKAVQAAMQQLNEELEKRVLLRTRELEVANQELESFSYSVSHDLRAPLRAINGFSQALLEDYGHVLDQEGLNYLGRVRAASQRMAVLIDDLLTLARVTRQEMRQTTIDLSEIATSILTELQTIQPSRSVQFTIKADLTAIGDPNLITIVLDNLLHNAWKYTSKHAQAHIEFGSILEDEEVVYYIKDDGAGFDMQFASKLFGAFQRLHNHHEFEGTGVGLATVQRIIHRHGGRVWARGAVEQGACFYFTLPATH